MPAPAVLIVEPNSDDREVLRTALERRGLRIFEASAAADGAKLAEEHHPAVIVLDLDHQADDSSPMPAEFAAEHDGEAPSIIILGKARRGHSLPADQVIAKPYRYAPLVHKIEELAAKAA